MHSDSQSPTKLPSWQSGGWNGNLSLPHVVFLPSADPARGLSRSRDCRVDLGSEVYRMLREPGEPTAVEPKQSGSFRYLQGMLEAGEGGKTPNSMSCPRPCTLHPEVPL